MILISFYVVRTSWRGIYVVESFKPPERLVNKPMRMCVQDIFKGQGSSLSVSGRMEAGDIQNGDKVMIMPTAEPATVKGKSSLL